jgi:hypothetical protein
MKQSPVTVNRNDLTKGQKDSMEYYHNHHSDYKVKRDNEIVDVYCSCGNDFSVSLKENVSSKCIKCGSTTLLK